MATFFLIAFAAAVLGGIVGWFSRGRAYAKLQAENTALKAQVIKVLAPFKKILVFIKSPPSSDHTAQQEWWRIVDDLQNVADTNKAIQTLTAGAWLILAHDGMPFIDAVISASKRGNFSHRVLIVTDEGYDCSHEPAVFRS